jgi:hypothetical protein
VRAYISTLTGTVLKSSFTTSFSSRPYSLNTLQFVHAASIPRASLTVPWFFSLWLALLVLLSLLPAAMWSGAITPILSERVTSQTAQIPSFQTTNLSSLWEGNASTLTSGSGSLGQWLTPDGLFSFDPSALRSLILNSASDASTTNTTGHLHQKLDKTGFLYLSRSYGVGAATGLVDLVSASTPHTLSYSESGFHSEVSCIYNESSAYRIDQLDIPSGWTLSMYQAAGSYPTGDSTGGWVYVGYSPMDIFSWGATYANETRRAYVSLTTAATPSQDAWSFSKFKDIQCQIDFHARNYSVLVNYTNNVISVTPGPEVAWPDYADAVLDKVSNWLWVFSYVDSSFGGSYLGRTLRLNVNKLQNATSDVSPENTLRGVADYITSCTDDILIALSSARVVAANATSSVEAAIAVPAVALGETIYIASIVALNMLVCLVYAFEAVRTGFWRNMPRLDLMDLTSIIPAAWKGGMSLENDMYDDSSAEETLTKECQVSLGNMDSGFPCILRVPTISNAAVSILDNANETASPHQQRSPRKLYIQVSKR